MTYAIKDTTFEGVEVKKGDYMAIAGKSIIACGQDRKEVMLKLLDKLFEDDEKELLTIIVGDDRNEEEVKFIEKYVNDNSDFELEIVDGKQPVYSYLIGLE